VAVSPFAVFLFGTLVQRVCPFFLPHGIRRLKILLSHDGKTAHQILEPPGCQQFGVQGEITLYNLPHVELAHLYPVAGQLREQALYAIDDDALYPIATSFDAFYRVNIVRHTLMPDVSQIKYSGCLTVNGQQDTAVVPPSMSRLYARSLHPKDQAVSIPY